MKLFGKNARTVADKIVESFRHPERLPGALAPIFIRRNDDVPCRKWSWHNQLLVALCGSADARGFRQWKSAGRHVKKGGKAIWILAPCLKPIKETNEAGEESKRQALIGFRSVPVFALEDTEGDSLPDSDEAYDSWITGLPLAEVATSWGIALGTYTHEGHAPIGYYQYAGNGGQAVMLGVENLSTWTHELVHAADHRLTNLAGRKWQKEIVAELGGAILLECLGKKRDADLGGAFAYIERYAQNESLPVVRACIQVLDRACNAVQLILDEAQRLTPTQTDA